MIDARKHHDPALAPGLIDAAIAVAGSQKELCERIGVTRDYLHKLKTGRSNNLSYPLQVTLEQIVKE